MKKLHKLIAFLLVLSLFLCGCKGSDEEAVGLDTLFETTENSLSIGQVFFAGKVLGKAAEARLISYYDAEMGKNTFYSVEITDDLFNCLPERTITVCVLGNEETFPDRTPLSKGKEYYFNTTLWVEGEEIIFLLPTFYTALPERENGLIYATIDEVRHECGSDERYRERLNELVKKTGYGPETVLVGAKEAFQSAAARVDIDYFETLKIPIPDAALLQKTGTTAAALLKQAEKTEATWEEIGGLLK